jgi:Tfp pilus assembly protein PilO
VSGVVSKIRGSKRASAIAVALGILLIAAAAWFGVVSPKRSHASELKTDVSSAETQLATATQEAAAANKAAAAAATVALPGTADQPGILDELNHLGKTTGVLVASVTPNTSSVTANAVGLTVIVNGNYFQIRNFLKRLRTQVTVGQGGRVKATGRLFDVQSVNVASGANGGALSATIDANAYMYTPSIAPPETVGTTATAAAGSAG